MAFDIHIHTQYCENYGDESQPYWKFKGGDTIVLTGFDAPFNDRIGAAAAAVVEAVRSQVEYRNAFAESYIIDWEFAEADTFTEDERLQQEYDGKILYPSKRIAIDI